jgi:hypothetical protein
MAIVPSVAGLSGPEAMARLAAAGLVGGVVGTQVSDTVPRGRVVESSPAAGSDVPEASNVFLFASMGPRPGGTVPDVAGTDPATARERLVDAGYQPVEHPRSDALVPAGAVIGTLPPAGSAVPPFVGVGVSLLVSTGREPWGPTWPDGGALRAEVAAAPAERAAARAADAARRLRRSLADQDARIRAFGDLVAALRAGADRDTALVDQLDAELRRLRERRAVDAAHLADLDADR